MWVTSGRAGLPWPTRPLALLTLCCIDKMIHVSDYNHTGASTVGARVTQDTFPPLWGKSCLCDLPSSTKSSLWYTAAAHWDTICNTAYCTMNGSLLLQNWLSTTPTLRRVFLMPWDPAAPTLNTNITLHSQILMLLVSDPSMQWWQNAWINTVHKCLPS